MADRIFTKTFTLDTTGIQITAEDFAPDLYALKPLRFLRVYIFQPSAGELLLKGDNDEGNDFVTFAGSKVQFPVELDLDIPFDSFTIKASTGTPTVGILASIIDKRSS